MTIVEVIHGKIDQSIEEVLANIENEVFVESVKPDDISVDQFQKLANYYRFHYPQNTFITEKQVKDICLDHDLVVGPSFAFTDEMPEKNKLEAEWFKNGFKYNKQTLLDFWFDSDIDFNQSSHDFGYHIINRLRGRTMANIQLNWDGQRDEAILTLEAINESSNPIFFFAITDWLGIEVVPNKPKMLSFDGLIETEDLCEQKRFCYHGTEVVCNDFDPYTVNITILSKNPDAGQFLRLPVDHRVVRGVARRFDRGDTFLPGARFMVGQHVNSIEVDLFRVLDTLHSAYQSLHYLSLEQFVDQKIIASESHFDTSGFRVVDEYKLEPDFRNYGGGGGFVPDPIVLQPVKGGYLVVTKWGEEVDVDEVQNETLN